MKPTLHDIKKLARSALDATAAEERGPGHEQPRWTISLVGTPVLIAGKSKYGARRNALQFLNGIEQTKLCAEAKNIISALAIDPMRDAAFLAINRLSVSAAAEGLPIQYTYNKILRLMMLAHDKT